jgi:hypothetical protein
VVIGSHGRTGFRRLLLGSTTEAVVRAARCPVIVARAKEYPEVTLSRVVRIDRAAPPRPRPRRYSYTTAALPVRPDAWPLH